MILYRRLIHGGLLSGLLERCLDSCTDGGRKSRIFQWTVELFGRQIRSAAPAWQSISQYHFNKKIMCPILGSRITKYVCRSFFPFFAVSMRFYKESVVQISYQIVVERAEAGGALWDREERVNIWTSENDHVLNQLHPPKSISTSAVTQKRLTLSWVQLCLA